MKYTASFKQGKNGNCISEGSILKIKIDGANFFSGAIYQKGFPVIAFQTQAGDDDIEILVSQKNRSLKGKAVLKVRAFDSKWRGAGWNDEFDII